MLIHDESYIHVRHGRQGPFRVRPITWLQLDFLGLVGTMSHDISANELHLHVPSQQKMKRLDGLILKLTTFTSSGKHQLLTLHAASATRARGANVNTRFRDTFSTSPIQPSSTFLWTRFMYYILFIFLSMAQAHVTIWGKLRKCGLEGMGRFLSDLLHEPIPMRATKWARDTDSTSGSWRRSCIQNFHPKIAFML